MSNKLLFIFFLAINLSFAQSKGIGSIVLPEITDTIQIATEEYPPFTSSTLTDQGIDCELVRQAFRAVGIHVVYTFLPAKRSLEDAKNGVYDATLPGAKREGRELSFEYSDPVVSPGVESFFSIKPVVENWDPMLQNYDALKGMVIGATIGHNYGEKFNAAEKKGLIKVQRVASLKQNFKKLVSKRIDAFISSTIEGHFVLQNHRELTKGLKILVIPENVNAKEFDYLLFSKKGARCQQFLKFFNKGLKLIKASGIYKKTLNRYKLENGNL